MSDKIMVGNQRRLKVSFYNGNEPPQLADPSDVILIVKSPSGAVNTYTPTKDSTGKYHKDVQLDESGVWYYRYEGTGGIEVKEESEIVVTHSRVI